MLLFHDVEPLQTITNEITILLWTLIITIISLIIATIFSVAERIQCAKHNSVNVLKKSLEKPFRKNLIKDFSDKILDCKYKFFILSNTLDTVYVTFDRIPLVKVQNVISNYLGEISYLRYAIPIRYYLLNRRGQKVISYIEEKMLPYAAYEGAPISISGDTSEMVLAVEEARKIYKKFSHLINVFYITTFKIYKHGI